MTPKLTPLPPWTATPSGLLITKSDSSSWITGNSLFSFRNYEVTTGHVDWYYKLPFYNVTTKISAGL